jgi:outer membrane protein assembly factor BamB
MPEMENYDSTLHSAVFQFDIKTGKLINKYETKTPTASVFGDLTLNSKGQVFVSDGKSNSIFVANESTRQLDLFYTSEEFWNIQGISFSNDDRYLFISDYIKGLYRLEIGTKTLIEVSSEIEQSLKGIDGLLFYNGDLIAIQNGVSPLRTTRYTLNNEMTRISSATMIDRGHPAFNEPTMGCLNGTEFYYVANSAWKAYDDNFQLKPELVKNVVILKTNFKK